MNPDLPETNSLADPILTTDWESRQDSVRDQEWELYRKGLKIVDTSLQRLLENPPATITLAQVARLLEVVNDLGRAASGLGSETIHHRVPENTAFLRKARAILDRVFSEPDPDPDPEDDDDSDFDDSTI